jgi:choline-glycine betaine transporter
MGRRAPLIPWWPLATTLLLAGALALSVAAGRTVDSIIIGVLLVPSLAFLVVWLIAWRRGPPEEDR